MSLIAMQGGATGTGTVTLLAPVTNTNRTLTLPDDTGTVVSTASTAVVTPAMLTQPFTSGTAVASTSGTSIDFTGIPSWVKRITVMFQGVSTNGSSNLLIRIGSGSFVTTSYVGSTALVGSSTANAAMSTGFMLTPSQGAATVTNGNVTLTLQNSSTNLFTENGILSSSDNNNTAISGGNRALSGALDRVRITTVNGTDTFDAGTVNIMYEG